MSSRLQTDIASVSLARLGFGSNLLHSLTEVVHGLRAAGAEGVGHYVLQKCFKQSMRMHTVRACCAANRLLDGSVMDFAWRWEEAGISSALSSWKKIRTIISFKIVRCLRTTHSSSLKTGIWLKNAWAECLSRMQIQQVVP